eukprot:COSAG06_NODE_65968_length_255_cov_1.121795_1_plen_20_part_10
MSSSDVKFGELEPSRIAAAI